MEIALVETIDEVTAECPQIADVAAHTDVVVEESHERTRSAEECGTPVASCCDERLAIIPREVERGVRDLCRPRFEVVLELVAGPHGNVLRPLPVEG